MEDELVKKIQNLEVLPSQRANDLFRKKQSRLVLHRSNGIWRVAAGVVLGSLAFLVYLNQEDRKETRNSTMVQKVDTGDTGKPIKNDSRIAQFYPNSKERKQTKKSTWFAKGETVQKQGLLQADSVQNEFTKDDERFLGKLNTCNMDKMASMNAFLLDVQFDQKIDEINGNNWVILASNSIVEEEVKKGDVFVQELMLLKYGEIIDEKATIAKLFTKEDNFLYNEANEFKSRVTWFKNKLSKE